jgi:hypothetical protein
VQEVHTLDEWLANHPELASQLGPDPDSPCRERQFKRARSGETIQDGDNRIIDPATPDLEQLDTSPTLRDVKTDQSNGHQPRTPASDHWRNWRLPGDEPVMYLLLGLGIIGWSPELEPVNPNGHCPVCHGQRLAWWAVCLSCLRSGLDSQLPSVPQHDRPKRHYRPDATLKGGLQTMTNGKQHHG